MRRLGVPRQHGSGGGAQPPASSVADDGVADLGAGSKADSRRSIVVDSGVGIALSKDLKDEPGGDPFLPPAGHPEEVRPALEALDRDHRRSGGQALAALGTTT